MVARRAALAALTWPACRLDGYVDWRLAGIIREGTARKISLQHQTGPVQPPPNLHKQAPRKQGETRGETVKEERGGRTTTPSAPEPEGKPTSEPNRSLETASRQRAAKYSPLSSLPEKPRTSREPKKILRPMYGAAGSSAHEASGWSLAGRKPEWHPAPEWHPEPEWHPLDLLITQIGIQRPSGGPCGVLLEARMRSDFRAERVSRDRSTPASQAFFRLPSP